MRSARIGGYVTIRPYDWRGGEGVDDPDAVNNPATHLKTLGARGGTMYAITDIRRMVPIKRLPDGIIARYHIRAIKLGKGATIPDDSRVLTLAWNDRGRSGRRG